MDFRFASGKVTDAQEIYVMLTRYYKMECITRLGTA